MRLQIARYACENGISAASLHFSRKLGHPVTSSTVHSIKTNYLEEIKKLKLMGKETSLDKLPVKKQGRPRLLGEKIGVMVQSYSILKKFVQREEL